MLRTRSIVWIVCLAVSMLATVGYAADQRTVSVTVSGGGDGISEALTQTFQAVEQMTGIKVQVNAIPGG
jgi:maltose-binding protein MalE